MADFPNMVSQTCGFTLAIIDDLEEDDKMKINRIEKMILALNNQEKQSSKGVLIVITSRMGTPNINNYVLEHAKDNLENRERMKYVDLLDDVIGSGTVPLYSNLVDFSIPIHILPFLPLTREHIRECTKKLYNSKNMVLSPLEIQRIVDQISFFSQEFPIFAKHGCKQVAAKMKTRKSQEL